MVESFDLEQIRAHWWSQARTHGQSHKASWSDLPIIELEIGNILEFLSDGDRVLDIGCGSGWSTVRWAAERQLYARGLDYVPEMIEQARLRVAGLREKLLGEIEFDVGEITALRERDAAYDKVVVIRVIINLEDWRRQQAGLRECVRVLKPGGLLLLSEATLQGWERLNRMRAEWDLPPLPVPPFNRYLDQDQVIEAVASELRLLRLVDFASTYYVGTRVLKPLLIRALGSSLDVADPNAELNRFFAQLPPAGDYGTQKLFVFEKRHR